jgi:hypothetical protein
MSTSLHIRRAANKYTFSNAAIYANLALPNFPMTRTNRYGVDNVVGITAGSSKCTVGPRAEVAESLPLSLSL